QAAPAIVGGREFMQQDGQLERGAIEEPGGYNNFQARYIIRHEWTGPINCDNPQRGIWGGPWPEVAAQGATSQPIAAQDLAFVQRGAVLADYVTEGGAKRIEEDVGPLPKGPIEPPLPDPRTGLGGNDDGGNDDGGGKQGGCAHCSADPGSLNSEGRVGAVGLALLALLGAVGIRRRRDGR
ncbi:MAG TPA: hypothetical protein VM869_21545, partial [Enhygromyxa sp.]|nr:hypothetical protein [Enhygromyxa sp.]